MATALPISTGIPAASPLSGLLSMPIGDRMFFALHGRAYSIAPLPFTVQSRVRALAVAALNTPANDLPPRYFRGLVELADELWKHCTPVGRIRRMRRRVGMLANPLRRATEKELVAIAGVGLRQERARGIDFGRRPR